MAIVKTFNPAPEGLGEVDPSIEVEPNEPIIIDIEGEETFEEDDLKPETLAFDGNLADYIPEDELKVLAEELIGDYEDDCTSREEWMRTYIEGIDLLGLKIEERTEPWDGACGVHHPLLSEALVKFQAETMMEIFPAAGPVRTQIIGEETKEKMDAAKRVKEDMNFEIVEKMQEFRPEHERLLWNLGLSGNAFKKVYFDPTLGRQVSLFIPGEDVVVPYGASSLETADRVTHVMRKYSTEVKKLQQAGFYSNIELDEPTNTMDDFDKEIAEKMGFSATMDDRYKILEMHVNYNIPGFEDEDGIPRPYVVTIEKCSGEILAIRRNWLEGDERKMKRNHLVHYSYIPGFGFYAFGLVHLIGAFAKSGTSLIRQLVDAGTLSNLPGGFKANGLRVKGDDTPIGPAEFRDVDVPSGTIRENILPLPYKEPSQTLFALLQNIVEEGRRFASAADMKVSDMSSEAPVGTTLAILERSLKVMSAVQARIHYSMKQEFKLLKALIRDFGSDEYSYDPTLGDTFDKKADYDMVEVLPVSDPNQATMAQKVVQYQAVLQLAQTAPHLYDMPFLHRSMLGVLSIKDADKLVPLEDEMKPQEPVAENMNIINGKPVKAHLYQDHEAHITVHTAAMQDPEIMKMVGQSPQAQAIGAAMEAHIAEHLAYAYRKQIEDSAGVPYPHPEAEMDEETELNISRLAAAASQQVLNKNRTKQAAEQAQQAAQDPILQQQLRELGIKEKAEQTKVMKILVDAAARKDELASRERIEGMKIGLDMTSEKASQQRAGVELGIDIIREAREDHARKQAAAAATTQKPDKKG